MALERKDSVKDQTSTTGTGSITLDGVAPAGYRTVAGAHTNGATVRYRISGPGNAEWEIGEGVFTSPSTLSRTSVFASSNTNALVNFSVGTKSVMTVPTAKDLNDLAPLVNPNLQGLTEVKTAMAANNVDLSTGNWFTKTISAITTFTVSNVPAAGTAASFILELTNGGSQTITWFTGTKWAGGTAPTLTAAGVDILGFYTHDGGTTWRGLTLSKDSR